MALWNELEENPVYFDLERLLELNIRPAGIESQVVVFQYVVRMCCVLGSLCESHAFVPPSSSLRELKPSTGVLLLPSPVALLVLRLLPRTRTEARRRTRRYKGTPAVDSTSTMHNPKSYEVHAVGTCRHGTGREAPLVTEDNFTHPRPWQCWIRSPSSPPVESHTTVWAPTRRLYQGRIQPSHTHGTH